jgi:hypothetical protein
MLRSPLRAGLRISRSEDPLVVVLSAYYEMLEF